MSEAKDSLRVLHEHLVYSGVARQNIGPRRWILTEAESLDKGITEATLTEATTKELLASYEAEQTSAAPDLTVQIGLRLQLNLIMQFRRALRQMVAGSDGHARTEGDELRYSLYEKHLLLQRLARIADFRVLRDRG